jgi:hypothetical protein
MIQVDKIIEFFEEQGLLKKQFKGRKADLKKSKHCDCYTCQLCGYFFDECVCGHNKTIKWLETNKVNEVKNDK